MTMGRATGRFRRAIGLFLYGTIGALAAMGTAGCVSRGGGTGTAEDGDDATRAKPFDRAALERHVPPHVPDRGGWANDIADAIEATGRPVTAERACAVIAVIEQESGFKEDPPVQGLPRIVREGLRSKLAALGPLAEPATAALLEAKVPGSEETFGSRVDRLRSERDLDRLFRTMANGYRSRLPGTFLVATALSRLLGKGSLEDLNPITTAGSMQVKIAFARTIAAFDGLDDAQLREQLYTRAGGVRAGTEFLLGYQASYDDLAYRFADYNAGRYASRNAAFQAQVADLAGKPLALDGDLLAYDEEGDPSETDSRSLSAILAFAREEGIRNSSVRRQVRKEKERDFEETEIWERVKEAWKGKHGRNAPYAMLPNVSLDSPKMRGGRSTAWFASQVKRRYVACRARGD